MNDPKFFGMCVRHILHEEISSNEKYIRILECSRHFEIEGELLNILNKLDNMDSETFGQVAHFMTKIPCDDTNKIESNSNIPKERIENNSDTPEDRIENNSDTLRERAGNDFDVSRKRTRDNSEPYSDNKRMKARGSDNYVILNEPRSYHSGRPCSRCNILADYFNKRGSKIMMPKQHPYGKCPLYCNICSNKQKCLNPEQHLRYSCNNCETTYSNHPLHRCTL